MRTPWPASATPSSTSGTSVMHTGQPGPMMTFNARGSVARRPNRAMACSWLPQTCITDTGSRPISPTTPPSAIDSARARPGSRNFSSDTPGSRATAAGLLIITSSVNLGPDIGRHQVVFGLSTREQLLVERQRGVDLRLRDAADGIAHMVEDVVTRLHGLVDDLEPDLLAHAPEVDGGDQSVDVDDFPWHSEAHSRNSRRPAEAGRCSDHPAEAGLYKRRATAAATTAWPSASPPSPGGTSRWRYTGQCGASAAAVASASRAF